MGATTLAVRLKPEPNRDGEHVIRIRITRDRSASFWALNMAVAEKHFDEKGNKERANWIRKSYRDYKLYNERIREAYLKAEQAVAFFDKRDSEYSAMDVRNYLEIGGFPDRLLPFFADHIAHRRRVSGENLGKIQTADTYEATLKVLRLYARELYSIHKSTPNEEVDARSWMLGKLTKKDILDLKAWLQKHYAQNSVNTYLTKLRHVLFQAAEVGLVSYDKFPMRGVSIVSTRKKVDRLQQDEIDQLASEPAPKKHTGGRRAITEVSHAQPLALAMYFAHGARLGDAILWRVENYVIEGDQHRLKYTTTKSKKSLSVLLDEQAIELLKPYLTDEKEKPKPPKAFLFPYLPDDFDKLSTADQYIHLRRAKMRARQQIGKLGQRVGLTKKVTPHVMRHSFADMMRRSGVQLETRQEALGHSDIKTTRNYEEQFDQEAVDRVSSLFKRTTKSGQQ
ncbi:tyrosine-type recombinase/integrase [Spirosoma aerolatum]|uniref:tyrosine-type recombinase/integrase n=1 Tax=Spirosoma aerolatum TaxID=1211326 RepID=UPI0009AD5786|nr:tyrosine-type recombinase/integrase [Spirosoma aerolatum]